MGIRKGALFLSLFVPFHKEEPLPEPFEVPISVRGVDYGLGGFLAFHPSYTKPSSDSMGPSVRSKSSGFIPKESKNELESMRSPFDVFATNEKIAKEAFSFKRNQAKL